MDKNKKIFLVAGIVTIVLIFIVLILIVILENKNQKQIVRFSMNIQDQGNNTENTDTAKNSINSETDKNEETIEGEIVYVKTADGKEIPVPPSFEYVEGDSQTGAVIKDKDENEFVWIPIDDFNLYQRQVFNNNGENITVEDMLSLNLIEENAYNMTFTESVQKYHGFYVARYEARKSRRNG